MSSEGAPHAEAIISIKVLNGPEGLQSCPLRSLGARSTGAIQAASAGDARLLQRVDVPVGGTIEIGAEVAAPRGVHGSR